MELINTLSCAINSINKKKLIQKYNARVKHNENYKAVKFLEGVTVIHKARRYQENSKLEENENTTKQEPISKNIKKEAKGKEIRLLVLRLKGDRNCLKPEYQVILCST